MRSPNGFGSVINLGKNRRRPFAVRITTGWTDEGKQIYKYISYHEKKTEAIMALADFNRNPYDLDASRITFKEIYERLMNQEEKTLSSKSLSNYKSAYKHCQPLYNKVFKEIKKSHLQGVIDDIESNSMPKVTKLLFQKMYKYAMENDIVTTNYSQFVKLPKKQVAKKKTPFTKTEINNIWDNIDNIRNADIVLILLYTGMRISELLTMKKENIHLDKRYMIGGLKTEAGIDRMIPIHKRILPLIEDRMNKTNYPYLITNKSGTKMGYDSFRKYYLRDFLEDTKVEHTIHDTRHTFISELDRLNVNSIVIKRIVGHSDSDVTEHYTHKDVEELLEAVDKISW